MQQCYDISNIGCKLNRISSAPYGLNAKNASQIATFRKDILKRFDILRSKGLSIDDIVEILSVSKSTLYRWKARYKKGFECLKPRSRRPISTRKSLWPRDLVLLISRLRKQYPLWGKAKIKVLLDRQAIPVSTSTVGRIISHLIAKGRILSANILKGHNCPKRRRKFSKHAVRLPKGMRSHSVGELLQIDHMTVMLGDKKVKHFNAWDRKSKWNIADVYSNASAFCAAKFLDKVIAEAPFKIKSIQVDGGCEFMKEFEESCKNKGIKLYVLPPRSPELNGGVERINGTWRDEFYNFYSDLPRNILELSSYVKKYQKTYNEVRPHQNLGYKTPLWYIENNFRMNNLSHMS